MSISVARHRSGQRIQKNLFTFQEEQFSTYICSSVEASLKSMVETAKQRSFSLKRKVVGEKAAQILQGKDIFQTVCETIKPYYANVFELASQSTGNMNEALFAAFRTLTVDDNLSSKLEKITESNGTFVACFLHQVMQQLISSISQVQVNNVKQTMDLTDMEQNVIFYISGYMIHALHQKASKGSKCGKKKLLLEAMEQCLSNISPEGQAFVGKYSEWFDKVNRGGLTTPCASFFLMVREMENCYRQNVDESKSHIDLAVLVELMVENFMIRYYAAKLFTGHFESFILEACIKLFLNIRGHAWARKCKNEDKNIDDKKALRKSLMTLK